MIFVTVGHQLPFDRLIRAVDRWAGARGRGDVIAQIGRTPFRPTNIEWSEQLTPAEFRAHVERAEVLVAHAGMGAILTALELRTPVIIMPRLATQREATNDHQLATARRFGDAPGIAVAMDDSSLHDRLDRIGDLDGGRTISPYAPGRLLEAVREFVFGTTDSFDGLGRSVRTSAQASAASRAVDPRSSRLVSQANRVR